MPDYLPAHRELVYASGVAEIAGGAGLMCPDAKARRWAGWWLIATLIAVFPANVHMAVNPERYAKAHAGRPRLADRPAPVPDRVHRLGAGGDALQLTSPPTASAAAAPSAVNAYSTRGGTSA